MRAIYILALVLLVGISAGIAVTWQQETLPYKLVPVDFDPLDICLWGGDIPNDLCI